LEKSAGEGWGKVSYGACRGLRELISVIEEVVKGGTGGEHKKV